MSALQAAAHPRHQSGQRLIKRTIGAIEKALANERRIHLAWVRSYAGISGNEAADRLAAMSTREDSVVSRPSWAKCRSGRL
jgi:ribonuclease HI